LTIPGSDRPVGAVPAPSAIDDPSIVRATGALWRTGDFGVVVLGTRRADPLTLAGTGVAVWEALAQPLRVHELVDRLAARFGAPTSVVADDLAPVLDGLLADGVLEVVA
jgi:hypothetical protein